MQDFQTTYSIEIHDEDGTLWATVKEVPGCFATGDTMTELMDALAESLGLALSTRDVEVGVHVDALEPLKDAKPSRGGVEQRTLALC